LSLISSPPILDYGFHHLGISDENGSEFRFHASRINPESTDSGAGSCSHCVLEPRTGSRKSLSPSNTSQTGIEIVFPDFLPMTLILIWR
jgi:hypothetical protein